jgi:D-serine deaminase-like pyridoxal phosphate-dependent protein
MKRVLAIALSVIALCVMQVVGIQAQAAAAKTKAMTAAGTVKSVSGNSLVISATGGKDMTFTLDSSTKFVGKGLSTKSKGAPMSATEAVAANDKVSVTYHDMGASLHAASVRIVNKAMVKK